MLQSHERRVAALEAGQTDEEPTIILMQFVDPAQKNAPSVRSEFGGFVVERKAEETDAGFDARVISETVAARPGQSVYVIHMFPAKEERNAQQS